ALPILVVARPGGEGAVAAARDVVVRAASAELVEPRAGEAHAAPPDALVEEREVRAPLRRGVAGPAHDVPRAVEHDPVARARVRLHGEVGHVALPVGGDAAAGLIARLREV